MCGIVGFLSFDGNYPISDSLLESARDTMAHRGPDDAGLQVIVDGSALVGLGHRRLSILDLTPLGHQPMSTADGRLWIVFNGEIFNYRELRRSLEDDGGYRFLSTSDTEVILYAVRHWGLEGSLKRFRGMYAFALYDRDSGTLKVVRDPLGVKPLYFHMRDKFFAFASEIKALLAMPGIQKRLNERALYHYLTFANAPAPETFFEGIHKLEAGTYLEIDAKGNKKHIRYWDPARFSPNGNLIPDEQECILKIRSLLRQAVARRMVSDVPFGVFLSGGVDSSLNVALMAEQMDRPVETFSVGILGDPSNEFNYARQVANHFKTNHHEIMIGDDDFLSFLPRMAYLQDEPMADPVCVPLYYVSRLAREAGTIVIQVGEGSDEIFAGYDMYRSFKNWTDGSYNRYSALPAALKKITYDIAHGLFDPARSDALRRAMLCEPLFMGNAIAFWDEEKQSLLNISSPSETSSELINRVIRDFTNGDTLWKIINLELKNRLPELLLMRVDKMSMGASIETRVPFLDEDLVEYALTIPSELKQRNGHNKYILKKAAEGIIPNDIIYRKKWGFCGSATNMMTDKIVKYAREKILDSPLTAQIFNRDYISQIFNNHVKQKRFNSFKIWNLLNLSLWHEQWIEGANRQSP